jgi:predicted DNA-binding protein
MPKLAVISGRLPAELKDSLKKLAEADNRKLWPYVQIVLEQHVATKKAAGKRK